MTREEILQIAKPILFNTDMVRAILDNRKSVTRRVANINTDISCNSEDDFTHEFIRDDSVGHRYTGFVCRKCGFGVCPPHSKYPCGTSWIRPRYNVGDILYVRETWSELSFGYVYKAHGDKIDHLGNLIRWRPSIHMPKEAARIFLRVTDVRVERLQDITEEQAANEGCINNIGFIHSPDDEYDIIHTAKQQFINVWNSTIPKKDLDKYGWKANPWVWVIEFERVEVHND